MERFVLIHAPGNGKFRYIGSRNLSLPSLRIDGKNVCDGASESFCMAIGIDTLTKRESKQSKTLCTSNVGNLTTFNHKF